MSCGRGGGRFRSRQQQAVGLEIRSGTAQSLAVACAQSGRVGCAGCNQAAVDLPGEGEEPVGGLAAGAEAHRVVQGKDFVGSLSGRGCVVGGGERVSARPPIARPRPR